MKIRDSAPDDSCNSKNSLQDKLAGKTKEQLKTELAEALLKISELSTLETRCRQVEEKLSQQNEFFNNMLESLTHPFYVLDVNDYSIKIANSAARLGDLSSKPTCYGLTHKRSEPCDGVEHTCPMQEVKKTKKPFTVEHIHYDINGNPRDMEVHAYPIFDAKGNIVQMIEYSLDITERKKLERAVQDYAENIKRFSYSVTHDLKNPLISIHGLTEHLCKHKGDMSYDKWKTFCDQIIKSSGQALALIEEINIYIKTKEAPFNFEQLKPKEIIGQVREEFEVSLANRRITWSEPEKIPEIKADRMALLRLFRNLVDNALKYGGQELGEIKIGYEESDSHHIFSVSDDGQGIDEQNLEKIFGAFQRCQTQSDGPEGTGLGLAIVKEIAEKHGGSVWVQCGIAKGVIFYISIPKNL